jgi:hypothetical protein
MAEDDLMKIRITADFKEAEGAFLKMAKVATAFESDFRRISGGLNKEFNRINGMAELFGDTTNVVKDKMNALKRAMDQLMTTGLQAMNPEVQKLKAQYDELAASIVHTTQETTKVAKVTKEAGDSVKKSNMQWTNWALVLQDLPYGFRGIQNNLPALMGGIAGMAGPLYLVGSAIIALFTAWDQGSFKAEQAIDRVAEAHKRNTEVLTKGAEAEAEALVEMRKMSVIFDGVRNGTITAEAALKTYNETYGETWGIAKGVNEAEDSFIKKSSMYVKATALRAMANEKYAQAQEAFKTGRLAAGEDQTSFLTKFAAGMDALDQVGIMGLDGVSLTKFAKAFTKNYAESQKVLVNDIKNLSASSFDALMSQGADLEKEANKMLSDAGIKPTGKGKKGAGEGAAKKDNFVLDSLKAKQKAYKDDIYQFRAYGILIINEEERIAKERAIKEGTYEKNKKELHARYADDRITNNNLFEANLNKVLDANAKIRTEQEKKELEIQAANRLNIGHAILGINKKFAEDDLRNAVLFAKKQTSNIQTELGVQDKLNKNNLSLRIEDTKAALAKLAVLAAFTFDPAVLAVYLDAIDKITAKLGGLGTTWEETIKAMGNTVKGFINDSLFALGESIGKVFAGENVDAIDVFGTLIADALQTLGKQLIAFGVAKLAAWEALKSGTPAGAALAIAAGIAAVAAGAALKSTLTNSKSTEGGFSTGRNSNMPRKFADGGIISGPTYGLMGEYPGAKSNPEVVAPLDKLKDMIGGGGGGTFMLRGQDLLLSVNRAQKASNLKGQNISLA